MWSSLIVLIIGAVLTAAAAFWVLRAYRRAGGGSQSPRPALAACVAVAIVGLGTYLFIGRPELPGAAYADRIAALQQRDPRTFSVEEALVMWTEIAKDHPNDPVPQLRRADILLEVGRPAEAARGYDAALRRDPRSAEALMGVGRSIVQMQGGLTPEALAYFVQAGPLTDDPAPWIYQAWAAMEAGRDNEARGHWREALQRMAPNDPRREMAQQMAAGRR